MNEETKEQFNAALLKVRTILYSAGWQDGHTDGYHDGYRTACCELQDAAVDEYENGWVDGYTDGHEAGLEDACQDGFSGICTSKFDF